MFSITTPVTPSGCTVCGRPLSERDYQLGYSPVCGGCCEGIAVRRAVAFLVDWVGWQVIVGLGLAGSLFFLELFAGIPIASTESLLTPLGLLAGFPFLLKDGYSGRSPGKALFGLRVVDAESGNPADFADSLKRNLPLLIPCAQFVVAVQLFMNGRRLGDGWAGTRVVRNKGYVLRT